MAFEFDTKVYTLGEDCALKEISLGGVEIGNRVRYARNNGIYTVIGKEISGWTIANGKGDIHGGQVLEARSPFLRIAVLTNVPNATAEEISAIRQAVDDKRAEDKKLMAEEAALKQTDYERIVEELKKNYPNAAQTGSHQSRAAKNIKAELKKAFPTVVFSVKSEGFSGGTAVTIHWTHGCTSRQVEAITGKYKEGNFNGMEDIYDLDCSAFARAAQEWLGSAKFVSVHREYTDELKKQVADAIQEKRTTELSRYDLEQTVYRALQNVEIYGEFLGTTIESGEEVAQFAGLENAAAADASGNGQNENNEITGFTTAEFTHTTNQTTCYVATLTTRLDKEDFASIRNCAKGFGGYYSKFAKNGAIAGFIFSSADDRQKFLNRYA